MKSTDDTGSNARSPTDIDRLVGENVRRLRIRRHATLAGLSAELGISHQQLQKYETGSNRLSAGMVVRLAEAFGVPIATMFQQEGAPAGKGGSRADPRIAALQEEGVWLLSRAGSEDTLRKMVDILRILAGKA